MASVDPFLVFLFHSFDLSPLMLVSALLIESYFSEIGGTGLLGCRGSPQNLAPGFLFYFLPHVAFVSW